MMNRTALVMIFLLIVPHGVEARATGREQALRLPPVCENDGRSINMHDSSNCALSFQSRSRNDGSPASGGVDGLEIGRVAVFNATRCGSRLLDRSSPASKADY
jgi:hypothetical protein